MKMITPIFVFFSLLSLGTVALAQEKMPALINDTDWATTSTTVFIILISFLILKCVSDILNKIAVRTQNQTDNKIALLLAKGVSLFAKVIDQFIGNSRNTSSPADKKA